MYTIHVTKHGSRYEYQSHEDVPARCVFQVGVPLHWPLINSDHMRTRLAKRELEQKRIEDARRWDPPYVSFFDPGEKPQEALHA
jgi:hypothetical protein